MDNINDYTNQGLISEPASIAVPASVATPEELYKQLTDKVIKYHPSADITLLDKAYKLAMEAHKDQYRKSGEPYIIHPLSVANILADLNWIKRV